MKKTKLFTFLLLLFFSSIALSQEINELKIGDTIPANIWKTIPKKANNGLIILDFWASSCASCIAAFPKLEKLQKEFDQELQIVLINTEETNEEIKKRFDKINKNRVKEKWLGVPVSLPGINGDKKYRILFPYSSVPHHVWLNKAGKVIAITYGSSATSFHVKLAIAKQSIDLSLKNDELRSAFHKTGYLQNSREGMPPAYYSAFISYYYMGSTSSKTDKVNEVFRSTQANLDPLDHFQTAYNYPRTVYELTRKERFKRPQNTDFVENWNRMYRYTYEIQTPLNDKDKWQEKYQIDANYFFGNLFEIEAVIEKRKCNAFVLVRKKEGLLKTAGYKNSGWQIKYTDSVYIHLGPFEYLTSSLYSYARLENLEENRVFVDETGIDKKLWLDLNIIGDLKKMSVEEIRKQLQKYGLDIIEAEREVEVLVIRDKPGWKSPIENNKTRN